MKFRRKQGQNHFLKQDEQGFWEKARISIGTDFKQEIPNRLGKHD